MIKSPYKSVNKVSQWVLCLLMVIFSVCGSYSQQRKVTPKPKKISLHSENNQVVDATSGLPIQYLNGDVKIWHEGTFMYCDTAILRGNFLRMRHNVVMVQHDTIRIFADSMRYNGDSLIAYLYGQIILENGPTKKLYTTYLKYDASNKIAYYTQNARMVDGKSTLVSKRGKYELNQKMAYFYDNVQARGEKFFMVSDSLGYNTGDQRVTIIAPTRVFQDTTQLYSERGWYDTRTRAGDFIGNAQYTAGKTIAKADTLSYDGTSDKIALKSRDKLSEYYNDQDTAKARKIYYDKKSELFTLIDDAWYKNKENEVRGKKVSYSKKDEIFKTEGRASVSDPPYIIDADTLDYSKAKKYGEGHGRVIWRDTSAKTTINAEHVFYDESISRMLAFNDSLSRPSFVTDVEGDTLTLKADTLRSFRVIKERIILPTILSDRELRKQKAERGKTKEIAQDTTLNATPSLITIDSTALMMPDTIVTDTIYTGIIDTIVYLVGDNDVRMYKSDMQSISDSLVFNRRDSIFTFYNNPFVWSDSTQMKGDTIDVVMKNGKADQMKLRTNASIINTEDDLFYNQIAGRNAVAFFVEGALHHMDVDGNAQLIYYLVDDDKAYIGVNTTEASKMRFNFKDKKVSDIKSFITPKSKVSPMEGTNHDKLRIPGFNWNQKKRPLKFEDL